MPERPLLPLPSPLSSEAPKGLGGPSNIQLPTPQRQIARHAPLFQRLSKALEREATTLELRDDPTSLAPERVIVFEIAGTIDNFNAAVSMIPGLELLVEAEGEFDLDGDFAQKDQRKDRVGQIRIDKLIPSRFYLAMPNVQALRELVRLWDRWSTGNPLPHGLAPFGNLFKQLRILRPWGPQDRVPDDAIEFWREELVSNPSQLARIEVEFWFYESAHRRRRASQAFRELVVASGGNIVHEVVIQEIAYHGALIDIPRGDVQSLVERQVIRIARADDVMFLRPQSLFLSPSENEPIEQMPQAADADDIMLEPPIAALLDGVPLTSHVLLENRLVLDDPDDLQSRVLVSERRHGTAMASLILHGDLNSTERSLKRRLYVRPLLHPTHGNHEVTDENRLLVDTLFQAVIRMKEDNTNGEAAAPDVFLVNLSVADPTRPFALIMSPVARLIDFLSQKYGILFLISGGNVTDPLEIPSFTDWISFEQAPSADRERAIIFALDRQKRERTLLSPAESINSLTIGAHHHDEVAPRTPGSLAIDPFEDSLLPNITSPLGLGYRRAIKPDLYFPGGREHVRFVGSTNGFRVEASPNQRAYGLRTAAPDASGLGRLDGQSLTPGTSAATALATRAGHQIFDSLLGVSIEDLMLDMEPEYYAVVVKALLVHRAQWSDSAVMIKDVCGPVDGHRHLERSENASRFLGFGVPRISEALECAENRATLIGFGKLSSEQAYEYSVPLPACLERVTDPRSLTVTLAWFSPVRPGYLNYRQARLEAAPLKPAEELGVRRRVGGEQPEDVAVKRGTVFHERYFGKQAVPFLDDGLLSLRVWRKKDPTGPGPSVRFGLAVTIESELSIPIYDEIRTRLRVITRA
jgi:Subtilase family